MEKVLAMSLHTVTLFIAASKLTADDQKAAEAHSSIQAPAASQFSAHTWLLLEVWPPNCSVYTWAALFYCLV